MKCKKCGAEMSPGSRYCGSCGYDNFDSSQEESGGNAVAAVKKNFPAKKLIIICAAVLALAVIITVVVFVVSCSTNNFRIGKVDKINIGDTKARVIEILGEPYDDNGGLHFEYYDDKYRELLEKSEGSDLDDIFGDIDSEDDLEDAFEDLEDAFTVLETTEYQYISVYFDSNEKVTEVFFDACRTEMNKDMPKLSKKHKVITDSILRYAPTDIYYSVEYEDGSFYKGTAAHGYIADKAGNSHETVSWSDRWDNKFSASIKVENNPDILSAGELAENIRYSLSKEHVVTISGSGEIESGGGYGPYVLIPSDIATIERVSIHLAADVTNFNPGNLSFRDAESEPLYMNIQSVSVAEDNPVYTVVDGCIVDKATGTQLIMGTSAGIVSENIKSIGARAFRGSEVTSIQWNATACESVADYAFYGTDISALTIAEGVQSIPYKFLQGADRAKITEVVLPQSLTEIGYRAFAGFGIRSITVPEGITKMGEGEFADCEQLQTVIWNVKGYETESGPIHNYVFGGCDAISKIVIGENVETIPRDVFVGITADVYVDDLARCFEIESFGLNLLYKGCNLYAGGELVTELVVPASVTKLDSYAFFGCISIEKVSFAGSNVEIGAAAFRGCTSLRSVNLTGVTEIGRYSFGSTALTSVTIPESVVYIATSAFEDCETLESVTFTDASNWVTNDYRNESADVTNASDNAQKFRDNNWHNGADYLIKQEV